MRTNSFLELYPPETHSWAGKVAFGFSYPTHGWIQFAVMCTSYVQNVVVYFSNVFNPFPKLSQWLNDIVDGKLLAEFIVEEEGKEKTFRATSVNDEEFIFEITQSYWKERMLDEEPIYLYVQVEKRQFLSEFLKRWTDFLENQYDPVHWEEHGTPSLREVDLSTVRAFVES